MTDTLITDSNPAAAPAPAPSTPNPTVVSPAQEGTPAAAPAGQDAPVTPGESTPAQKAAEQQDAARGDKPAGEAEQKTDDKAAGAPEKYEAFKAPEGVSLDAQVVGQFEEAARELNLPQDKAQQLMDKMAPVIAQQQVQQIETFRSEWHAQSIADPEFGGDKLNENMAYAGKALDSFATPELKTFLKDSALGNHPEFVRFMVRAGKAISEDKVLVGSQAASSKRSAADVLFGEAPKK